MIALPACLTCPIQQRALAVLEIPHDVRVYPGSSHRFMTETTGAAAVFAKITGMSYQQADAADSSQRSYAFFARCLDGQRGPDSAASGS